MEIVEIIRNNYPTLVRKMNVSELDKSKCPKKFLKYNFPLDMVVNVKCNADGSFKYRHRRTGDEYSIIREDSLKNI